MRNLVPLMILLMSLLSPASPLNGEPAKATIESQTLRVEFTNGALTALTNKLTGETYFGPVSGVTNVANIGLKRDQKETGVYVKPDTPATTPDPNTMIIRNIGDRQNSEMEYRFRVDPDTQDICFTIKARFANKGITGVAWGFNGIDPQKAHLIVPGKSGVEVGPYEKAGPGQPETFEYSHGNWPAEWNAQFALVQGNKGGFWVRTEDTNLRPKRVIWGRNQRGLYLSFESRSEPPYEQLAQMESVEWRINAYQGDWKVPTDQYHEWMTRAFKLIPKTQREPQWMNNIRLIVATTLNPECLGAIAKYVDPAKTLLYVRFWAEEQFPGGEVRYDAETHLAIYWPNPTPSQTLKDYITRAHELGFRVMPYVLFSSATYPNPIKNWPQMMEGIAMHPILDRERYHGTHTALRKLGVVPPDSRIFVLNPAWPGVRKGLIDSWAELIEETSADALHFDFPVIVGFDVVPVNGVGPREGSVRLLQEVRDRLPNIALSCENRYSELFANFITFPRDVMTSSNLRERYGNFHPICGYLYQDYMYKCAFADHPLATVAFPEYVREWENVLKPFGNFPCLTLPPSVPNWDLESVGPRYVFEEATAMMQNRPSRNQVVEGVNIAQTDGLFIPGWPACQNGRVQGLDPERTYALVPGQLDSTLAKITGLSEGVTLGAVRSDDFRVAFQLHPNDPENKQAVFVLHCPKKPVALFGTADSGTPASIRKVSDALYEIDCELPARFGALFEKPLPVALPTDLATLPAFAGQQVNGIVTEGRIAGGGDVTKISTGRALQANVRAEACFWEYRLDLPKEPAALAFSTRPHPTTHIIVVNGRELFREPPRKDGGQVERQVSLAEYANQPILLSLITEDAGAGSSGLWENPRLIGR